MILFYSRGRKWTWNRVFTPYAQQYIDRFYRHVEPGTGRRYRLGDLTGPGGAAKGNPRYEVMGVTRYWRYSQEQMQKLIRDGRIVCYHADCHHYQGGGCVHPEAVRRPRRRRRR